MARNLASAAGYIPPIYNPNAGPITAARRAAAGPEPHRRYGVDYRPNANITAFG
jgi:hypothetical protein